MMRHWFFRRVSNLFGGNKVIPFSKRGESWFGKVGGSSIQVGEGTYGHQRMRIREWGEGETLKIGRFCSIADGVTVFLGGNHRWDWVSTYPFGHTNQREFGLEKFLGHPQSNGPVVIGNDVWIGTGATILSGVTIGDGAVIAAYSNVTSDVLPYDIVGGNPARKIRSRFDLQIVEALLELRWWELSNDEIREIIPTLMSEPDPESLIPLIARFRGSQA